MRQLLILSAIAAVTALSSCGGGNNNNNNTDGTKVDRSNVKSDRAGKNDVIIHISGDIDKLNPLTYSAADAGYAITRMFMTLESVDPDSFNVFPVLAKERPVVTLIEDGEYKGGLSLTYEIRPEATWDNGTPITADDYVFSIKALKNPQVDAEQQRPYIEFIDDIIVDPSNNRKFTVMCKGRYMMSEISAGTHAVMPEYNYDPEKIMRKFTVKQLNDPKQASKMKSNPDIIKFAKQFNSEPFARDPKLVVGSGAYQLDQWVTGQRVVLKKKANWWGDKLRAVNREFEANPEKITYELIVDINAATSALKGEKIDVLAPLKAKDFLELEKDKKMQEKYNFYKPDQLSYGYLGLNMRNGKLADFKVRRALAHCLDVDKIIEKISYGLAKRVTGPISPRKPYYNSDLKPIPFDIAKASTLLDEAGWKDTDGDGFRDKVINGQKTKLSLEVKYPSGNDVTEKILTLFAENCKKAGVEITQSAREWTVFLQETKSHNFEVSVGGWVGSPVPDDPKQIWHTSSYNGGSNYIGFGDQKSDELIERIRYETDDAKRTELYKEFQKLIYDTQPYIFMSSALNRMAIHARFENAGPKVARPGYMEAEFVLDKTFGSKVTATQPQ